MKKFKIVNFNCMSCFHNIEEALKEFDETIEVKPELREKRIEVHSNHSSQKLISVISEAGYEVSEVT